MRRLKLPRLPVTQPEPLTEDEIRRVLAACLDSTYECRRNFAMLMLFLDTGIRLGELVNLRLSRIDFPLGEMTVIGKGNKERKVPVGSQAKKALLEYISKERREPLSPQPGCRSFIPNGGWHSDDTNSCRQSVRSRQGPGRGSQAASTRLPAHLQCALPRQRRRCFQPAEEFWATQRWR